jgi:hypothetical protein
VPGVGCGGDATNRILEWRGELRGQLWGDAAMSEAAAWTEWLAWLLFWGAYRRCEEGGKSCSAPAACFWATESCLATGTAALTMFNQQGCVCGQA